MTLYIQEYLQRIHEINQEYDLELRAEPGHYLMLTRYTDPSRDVAYFNDEVPYFNENKGDVIRDELLELTKAADDLDEEVEVGDT